MLAQYVMRSMRSRVIERNVNISTTSSVNLITLLPELCDHVSQYSPHSKLQLDISLEV